MTVRKRVTRDGKSQLFIEIRYRTADGRKVRFRRDAQVQTKTAALAEERRLLAELEHTGTLEVSSESNTADIEPVRYTFADAVRQYRSTRMKTLKPSTRITYEQRLTALLAPRFGEVALADLSCESFNKLDLELVRDGLSPSTRRNVQIVTRVILRSAVDAGFLASMPKLPRLPKVGRKVPNPIHRDKLDAILAVASFTARLAFALAAFAGLRRSEVPGLRWSDVDLKGNTITVRRAITRGEETTPKSGDHRVIPIAEPLRRLLESAATTRKNPWASVALTTHGEPWGESGLNQTFKRAQKRAGLGGWCFHDLRHFFASELFRKGVPAPVVQMLLGHADLATTQRYADMVASDLRAAVALFEGNSGATVESEVDIKSS